jgi:predicted transcriptional regulator
MHIGDICHRNVVSIGRDASIDEAARAMRTHHVGNLVVTEPGKYAEKPIGILTDRDIVIELVAKGIDLDTVTVGDVMGPILVTAKHDAEIFEALRFMDVKGVRRIPVLDERGELFGILSIDQVLAALAKEIGFLADISKRQIERERTARE